MPASAVLGRLQLLSLAVFALVLSSLSSPVSSQSNTTFPAVFPSASSFPLQYSASVQMTFGQLSYTSAFEEWVCLTDWSFGEGSDGIAPLVQQRGRYGDASSWLTVDYAFDNMFLLPSNVSSVGTPGQCSQLNVSSTPYNYFQSFAAGGSIGLVAAVLPVLNVQWTNTTNVLLADRNLLTTMWSMTTTILVAFRGDDSWYSATNPQLADVYSPALGALSPINEILDINFFRATEEGIQYDTQIQSIVVYIASTPLQFPDPQAPGAPASELSLIPVRMVVSGLRQLSNSSGPDWMPFTNYFDWSGVQPVTTQYYDMQDYTLCALADSATILPTIVGPSALSTAPPPALLPPSSFPPVFSGTIEALLSPPAANSSGVNGALILSQFREGSSTADGQWNWDENNQLQQLINSPAAPFASWYQFNHTVIGGVGGGSLWNLTAIDGNEAPYGGNAPPFACSWQWIAAANRSPLDYIHEQDLTKLWAMGNASLLLPLYSYNATVTVRGILVDQYLKQAVVHSPTDGNNYTYTQSIYVMHSGWQMQGRAGNGLLPPQSSMPVQIVTSGSYLSGGVAVPFTDYVNVFTIFPQASPFIFSPPSYNCQPPPRPSRPLFPSLQSVVAAGYYATVSLTSFYTER